jgi:HEAT repeat protein
MAARNSLARLTGADVDAKVVAMAGDGDAAVRAELLRAIGARRSPLASGTLLKAAADADDKVRAAALDALAAAGEADTYTQVMELLPMARSPADAAGAEKAAIAIAAKIETLPARAGPVVAGLPKVEDKDKPAFLRILGSIGGPDALKAVEPSLASADATVTDAAVRVLSAWPDDLAAADLLKVAKDSPNATHRSLALRGYLRLARET